jgi:hypothetical protein
MRDETKPAPPSEAAASAERCAVIDRLLLRDSDHTARHSSTSVTSRLRFQVVCFFVHDHRVANDRIGAVQLHHAIGPFQVRFARRVRFDVAQITSVTVGRIRRTMLLVSGIKMSACRCGFGIGTITELVNMKSMFARSESSDVSDNFHVIAGRGESDGAGDIAARSRVKDSDRFGSVARQRKRRANQEKQQNRENCLHALTLQRVRRFGSQASRAIRSAERELPAGTAGN